MWCSRITRDALLTALMILSSPVAPAIAAEGDFPVASSAPDSSALAHKLPFGVVVSTIPPENAFGRHPRGASVGRVFPDSVADKAGLQLYDVILKFGDKDIDTMQDVIDAVHATPKGTAVMIVIVRMAKSSKDKLTLTAQF